MQPDKNIKPDHFAVRTALWRAMHLLADASPHILDDDIGLKLVAPEGQWRQRSDMGLHFTRRVRASVVVQSRLAEDVVAENYHQGVCQYVLIGAGLDTFAQRRSAAMKNLQIFEVDEASVQSWKRQRLQAIGAEKTERLHFVTADVEREEWLAPLLKAGFDEKKPAVVAVLGMGLFLGQQAIGALMKQIAGLAQGSQLLLSYLLPPERVAPVDKAVWQVISKGARRYGMPEPSFFSDETMRLLAVEAGFRTVQTVSAIELAERYFANRSDRLSPTSGAEVLLATV